jgi:hypothetical protein
VHGVLKRFISSLGPGAHQQIHDAIVLLPARLQQAGPQRRSPSLQQRGNCCLLPARAGHLQGKAARLLHIATSAGKCF